MVLSRTVVDVKAQGVGSAQREVRIAQVLTAHEDRIGLSGGQNVLTLERFVDEAVGDGATLLLADAGMVPPGQTEIHADANARQTLVASRPVDRWQIDLFQNTPAALHWDDAGRDALTAELTAALATRT